MSEKKSMSQILDEPKYYALYQKGDYEVKVAKLELGTYVANSLEQHKAAMILTKEYGRAFASPEEVSKLPAEDRDFIVNGGASKVSEKERFTLCGTQGEMWNIPEKKLSQYQNPDYSSIVPEQLTPEFTTIKTVTDPEKPSYVRAIRIPYDISMEITTSGGSKLNVNDLAVSHGAGDYVCIGADDKGNPQPEWGAWVVNGEVMEKTYQQKEYAKENPALAIREAERKEREEHKKEAPEKDCPKL